MQYVFHFNKGELKVLVYYLYSIGFIYNSTTVKTCPLNYMQIVHASGLSQSVKKRKTIL